MPANVAAKKLAEIEAHKNRQDTLALTLGEILNTLSDDVQAAIAQASIFMGRHATGEAFVEALALIDQPATVEASANVKAT
jgi:hypothetical protein